MKRHYQQGNMAAHRVGRIFPNHLSDNGLVYVEYTKNS